MQTSGNPNTTQFVVYHWKYFIKKKAIVFHLWTIAHYACHQLATAMNLDISQIKLDIEHGKKKTK